MRPIVRCLTILIVAAACRETTEPAPPAILAPDSPALAKGGPGKTPTGAFNLRSTGNTSWSVSLAWDARTGTASYRVRDNWGREISVPRSEEHTSELQPPCHLVC